MTRITEQIERLQERIENAADRAGRASQSVRIVAVSKKHPPEAILAASDAGLTSFGENYVQEALDKIAVIDTPLEWHFIGTLQSNKAAAIAGPFEWVHTVTSERAARRLAAHRPTDRGELQVCIQLRPGDSDDRSGVDDTDAETLANLIAQLPNICLRGLMIVPLPGLAEAAIRQEFARTRLLLERLNAQGHDMDTLSMGMSGDLEAAIMEGSTMIRIGTDIFGPRSYD